MTPDQVSAFFDAGESFVEGTIAAALVALWLLAVWRSTSPARTWRANVHKFTLRLGADLWWIIYVALRDLILVQVFLGSFIFFYPDVVAGKDLPDHRRSRGGVRLRGAADQAHVAAATPTSAGTAAQTSCWAWGRRCTSCPYVLGVQVTQVGDPTAKQIASILVSSQNTDWRLPLCYLSAALVG